MSNEEMRAGMRARVLSCLMHGQDLANDRSWIAMHLGMSDRTVRQMIEELRNEGHLICNSQDGRGYFIAETDAEIARQYRQDCARAMSILRRIKPFRRAMKEIAEKSDQITFEDLAFGELIETF